MEPRNPPKLKGKERFNHPELPPTKLLPFRQGVNQPSCRQQTPEIPSSIAFGARVPNVPRPRLVFPEISESPLSSAPSTPSISVRTQPTEEEYIPALESSKREADISETPVQEQELATQTHEEFTAVPEQPEPVSETENKQESIVLTNDSQEPSMSS